jgi:hypothetical protein
MENNIICPICESADLKKIVEKIHLEESFTEGVDINEVYYECNNCGYEGDLLNENEKYINKALKDLKIHAVINILNDFKENNINFTSMERALEIPSRTFAKWRNGSIAPSSTGVALLKMLKTFPWLLKIADRDYDKNHAINELINAYNVIFNEYINRNRDIEIAGMAFTGKSSSYWEVISGDTEPISLAKDNPEKKCEYSIDTAICISG